AGAKHIIELFRIGALVKTLQPQFQVRDAQRARIRVANLQRSGRHVRAEHGRLREPQRRENSLIGAAPGYPNASVRAYDTVLPIAEFLVEHIGVEARVTQAVEFRGSPWVWEAAIKTGVYFIY